MLSNPVAPDLKPVKPSRPPAPYQGGKRILSKRLVPMINATPHVTYAEVFLGGGGVFLRRDHKPKAEVINDWSEDISTLFRILQHHYVALMDIFRWQLTTRADFDRLLAQEASSLTDLHRAARFLYLQRLSFGGKVAGRSFGTSPGNPARFDVGKLGTVLEAIHERLESVTIERLPWADFIRRYDRPGTLFYLDPPYYGCEKDYGIGMFPRSDFERMAELLRQIQGRFILSLNDHPEVRRIFDGFAFQEEAVPYTIAGNAKAKMARELIITG